MSVNGLLKQFDKLLAGGQLIQVIKYFQEISEILTCAYNCIRITGEKKMANIVQRKKKIHHTHTHKQINPHHPVCDISVEGQKN